METVQLLWKPPRRARTPHTSLWSEVGDGIDYYFVYGPELDQVVAGYRRVTGPAPMMPRWALGLWQSRQRYKTAKASLDVARRLPHARHPDRQHRAGLVLLEGRPAGARTSSTRRASPIPRDGSRAIHDEATRA